jgi:adenosylmethionine-8-amino-7-oxononanoate aminotransferase
VLERLAQHPLVTGHRGAGCFRALELVPGVAQQVVESARRRGLIVQPGPDCVQLVPALTYGADEFDELEGLLLASLDVAGERVAC